VLGGPQSLAYLVLLEMDPLPCGTHKPKLGTRRPGYRFPPRQVMMLTTQLQLAL